MEQGTALELQLAVGSALDFPRVPVRPSFASISRCRRYRAPPYGREFMNRRRIPSMLAKLVPVLALLTGGLATYPHARPHAAEGALLASGQEVQQTDQVASVRAAGEATVAVQSPQIRLIGAGTIWNVETADATPGAGAHSSLAIDAAGGLHVSYYDAGGRALRYAHRDGAWHSEIVDNDGDVGQYTSIALDGSTPHISYYDLKNTSLKHAYWTGLDWTTETVDNSADVGRHTALARQADGDLHLSYHDASNLALKFAYWNGTSWISDTLDSTGSGGQYTSLALRGRNPRISYLDSGNDKLRYAEYLGPLTGWDFSDVNKAGQGGMSSSLALDSAGNPHISYFRSSAEELRYAYHDGAGWVDRLVQTIPSETVHTSLALDASDRPHIAYSGDSSDLLQYAHFDGSRWVLQTVDDSRQVGGFPSLALDSDGYPHISYYHFLDGLKHAWLAPCHAPAQVTIQGPATVLGGAEYAFTAAADPPTATLPLTFTWAYPEWDQEIVQVVGVTETLLSFVPGSSITRTRGLTLTTGVTLSVSAESCGGAIAATHPLTLVVAPYPDLTVTDIWPDEDRVRYQVRNVGGTTVPAGYSITLDVDSVPLRVHAPPFDLAPGERIDGHFSEIGCHGLSQMFRVTADAGDLIREEYEDNNAHEETWLCDTQPPQITGGPTATLVSSTSVLVEWTTDETSDSRVDYGRTAGEVYDQTEHEATATQVHQVTLPDVAPGVYHYTATSADPSGNSVTSDDHFFDVPAAPTHLVIGGVRVARRNGFNPVYDIFAHVPGAGNRDRVVFYIDDVLVGTDYTPTFSEPFERSEYRLGLHPYVQGWTREEFFVEHDLRVEAYSGPSLEDSLSELFAPDPEESRVELQILSPGQEAIIDVNGDPIQAPAQVEVEIDAREYEWDCRQDPFGRAADPDSVQIVCQDWLQAVARIDLYVMDEYQDLVHSDSYVPGAGEFPHTFTWSAEGLSPGTYEIWALVVATDGNEHATGHTVHLLQVEPSIHVSRSVVSYVDEAYLKVQLTLENDPAALGTAYVDRITDRLRGLQPVERSQPNYTIGSRYLTQSANGPRVNDVQIDLFSSPDSTYPLAPGEELTVEYLAVPILYEDGGPDLSIGHAPLEVYYEVLGESFADQFQLAQQLSASQAEGLTSQADYLIVTNPVELKEDNSAQEADVDALLCAMAHLAQLRQGVLGYLETYAGSKQVLNDLVEPYGFWAEELGVYDSLHPQLYLLIVGETDIVPAWQVGSMAGMGPVDLSDERYSTVAVSGLGAVPTINVARIVGNRPADLLVPIRTSIDVAESTGGIGFDRSRATLLSGPGQAQAYYRDDILAAAADLSAAGTATSTVLGTDYYIADSFTFTYDTEDEVASGDLDGDGTDEIVLADASGDQVRIRDASGNDLGSFAPLDAFGSPLGFDEEDALAVGDVTGDAREEILIAEVDTHDVHVYDGAGNLLGTPFNASFNAGDALAVGDVDDDGQDETVRAHAWTVYSSPGGDDVHGFDAGGAILYGLYAGFEQGDHLAVGDVIGSLPGSGGDEIVISDIGTEEISVYSSDGGLLHTIQVESDPATYSMAAVDDIDAVDRLAVRRRASPSLASILLSDAYDDTVYEYRWVSSQGQFVVGTRFYRDPLHWNDGLAAGDVLPGGADEVIVANRGSDRILIADDQFPARIDQALTQAGNLVDSDIIFYFGHGLPDQWESVLDVLDFPRSFGGAAPIAFASACQTGDYEQDPVKSISEAMLFSGAAAYVGSTENTIVNDNVGVGPRFFELWDNTESIGDAFLELEIEKWTQNDSEDNWGKFWIYEFNLYGDPKFGASPSLVREQGATALASPASSLEIEIPSYTVTSQYGFDLVEIPGGQMRVEAGVPLVPYWPVTIEYPAGEVVQDVILMARSDAETATGLNLPLPALVHNQAVTSSAQVLAVTQEDEWIPDPEVSYTWTTWNNPDGTSTLLLDVYPLLYHPLRSDVEFHRSYTFTIQTSPSTVAVEHLVTEQAAYAQGEEVQAELWLENGGAAQDVVVSATVRRGLSGELVEGLPLRNLQAILGPASCALTWDSAGAEPGLYYLDVQLRDLDGNLLDQAAAEFQLGISAGEITSFTATPRIFRPGDALDVSMVFHNTGTVPITGTAIIQVETGDGLTVTQTFAHDVVDLAPDGEIRFDDVWDTSGVAEGDYRIVGYVLYDAATTGLASVTVGTRARLYLPLVWRPGP
jgi:hypothetical protein